MHELETLIAERIITGLRRKSITTCSKWAETYRFIGQPYPGPFSFKWHPWERAMHDSEAPRNVGQKAAQMGFTDTALNFCFYSMDILGRDVLYVLPSKVPDASEFSSGRFDPALELSPHLAKFFSDVKNIGHKRAGSINLYVRGSRSRSGLKSLPVARLVLDELDEMTQSNITLARERLSGQLDPREWDISTPTVEGVGINAEFTNSSQNHFFFRCPHCSQWIELNFPENLVITAEDPSDLNLRKSHLICHLCKKRLLHKNKANYLGTGQWVESRPDQPVKGWYINQLYSSTIKPWQIAELYLKSQSNKTDEQEFYNSKLGLPHLVEGANVTQDQINRLIGNYRESDYLKYTDQIVTMGIDQGVFNYLVICAWTINSHQDINANSHGRVLAAIKVKGDDFSIFDPYVYQYRPRFIVIDGQPERREATKFAKRFPGLVRLCFFVEGIDAKQIHVSDAGDEPSVKVDRTTWFDTAIGRFIQGRIQLPMNVSFDYQQHLQAPVRAYKKDKWGNPVGRWITPTHKPDHFALAQIYSEIALPLAAGVGINQTIQERIF